ncbi:hypothetical protein ACN1NW_000419 [Acinetobacter baumannii]|nr:hypothetical protein [Acinetobacter baumannii]ELB0965896.1 hypothetical protein [Acinetobacter baumannii]ELQ8922210.1 hypothetical protein [Acinetobacter baumannii]EMB2485597.1 hypothetical protein [Acinetobacter baumannii]
MDNCIVSGVDLPRRANFYAICQCVYVIFGKLVCSGISLEFFLIPISILSSNHSDVKTLEEVKMPPLPPRSLKRQLNEREGRRQLLNPRHIGMLIFRSW